MEETARGQIKKLRAERQKLLTQAKEALAKAQEGVAELNNLGFRYELQEIGFREKKKDKRSSEFSDD